MMKLSKDFFSNGEVLFVGYSSRNKQFSQGIYEAFTKNGIKVYPMNHKADASYDVKVYPSLADLPRVPESAYLLLNKDNAQNVVKSLADSGVKRVLFPSKKTADPETLSLCGELGIEAAVGCPMMLYGSGLHKVHAFFAGVK